MQIRAAIAALLISPLIIIAVLVLCVTVMIGWVFGLPVVIKRKGQEIGRVRWFTFYTTPEWASYQIQRKYKTHNTGR